MALSTMGGPRSRRATSFAFASAIAIAFATAAHAQAPEASPAAAPGGAGMAERYVRYGLALADHSNREHNYYIRALNEKPDYAPALFNLAELHRARGENDAALKRYLEALAADPSYAMAHFSLADFLWKSDVDPAPAEGEDARLEIHPAIRRLELARRHFQRYLELVGASKDASIATEARVQLAEVEGDLARLKNKHPYTNIHWEEAARILMRPADATRSPYEGSRIPMGIIFNSGSAAIAYESTFLLDAIARALETEGLRQATIMVEGHADSSGDSKANLDLSRRRAQSVKDYFVSRGLDEQRFMVAGYGDSRPLTPNSTLEMRMMNRRVEVVNWDEVMRTRARKEPYRSAPLAVSASAPGDRSRTGLTGAAAKEGASIPPIVVVPPTGASGGAVNIGAAAMRADTAPAGPPAFAIPAPAPGGLTPIPADQIPPVRNSTTPDPTGWDVYLYPQNRGR